MTTAPPTLSHLCFAWHVKNAHEFSTNSAARRRALALQKVCCAATIVFELFIVPIALTIAWVGPLPLLPLATFVLLRIGYLYVWGPEREGPEPEEEDRLNFLVRSVKWVVDSESYLKACSKAQANAIKNPKGSRPVETNFYKLEGDVLFINTSACERNTSACERNTSACERLQEALTVDALLNCLSEDSIFNQASHMRLIAEVIPDEGGKLLTNSVANSESIKKFSCLKQLGFLGFSLNRDSQEYLENFSNIEVYFDTNNQLATRGGEVTSVGSGASAPAERHPRGSDRGSLDDSATAIVPYTARDFDPKDGVRYIEQLLSSEHPCELDASKENVDGLIAHYHERQGRGRGKIRLKFPTETASPLRLPAGDEAKLVAPFIGTIVVEAIHESCKAEVITRYLCGFILQALCLQPCYLDLRQLDIEMQRCLLGLNNLPPDVEQAVIKELGVTREKLRVRLGCLGLSKDQAVRVLIALGCINEGAPLPDAMLRGVESAKFEKAAKSVGVPPSRIKNALVLLKLTTDQLDAILSQTRLTAQYRVVAASGDLKTESPESWSGTIYSAQAQAFKDLLSSDKSWGELEREMRNGELRAIVGCSEKNLVSSTTFEGSPKDLSLSHIENLMTTSEPVDNNQLVLNIDNLGVNWAEGVAAIINKLPKDGPCKTLYFRCLRGSRPLDLSELTLSMFGKDVELPNVTTVYIVNTQISGLGSDNDPIKILCSLFPNVQLIHIGQGCIGDIRGLDRTKYIQRWYERGVFIYPKGSQRFSKAGEWVGKEINKQLKSYVETGLRDVDPAGSDILACANAWSSGESPGAPLNSQKKKILGGMILSAMNGSETQAYFHWNSTMKAILPQLVTHFDIDSVSKARGLNINRAAGGQSQIVDLIKEVARKHRNIRQISCRGEDIKGPRFIDDMGDLVKALVNAKEPGGVSAASCALRLGPFWEGRYEPAENALPPETYDVGKKKAVQNAYEKACCDAKTFTGEYFAKSLNPLIGAEYAEIDVSGGDFGLLRLIEVGQEGLNMQTPAEWTDDKIQELLARELLRLLGRDSIGSTRLKFSFPDTSKSWTDKRYQRITETKELIKGFSSYFASNRNKYKWETVYHSKLWGIPETLFTRIKEERFGYFVASMEGDTLHIELKRNSQSS